MNDALYIAATGMQMQQKNVDTISNNLANVNTVGFKSGKVSFEDLVYRDLTQAASVKGSDAQPMRQGSGVALASLFKSFAAGEMKQTGRVMDVAIKGDGFVEVETADNGTAYYRGGTLTVDKDGMLATGDGHAIKPSIHVGNDGASMIVQADGQVLVQAPGQAEPAQVGHLDLVRFADTTGLVPLGANLYQSSARSGEPITGRAGEDGLGTLAQGYTEASNVNLVEEMINLMVAQRAYESNVKIIQAADDMLSMSNNLRR